MTQYRQSLVGSSWIVACYDRDGRHAGRVRFQGLTEVQALKEAREDRQIQRAAVWKLLPDKNVRVSIMCFTPGLKIKKFKLK